VLSVGRFEWRRYERLGLPGDAALREAVARVPPRKRHFFMVVEGTSAEVVPVTLRRFGTRNEARALAALVRERRWRTMIVVSSGFHLRRVALVLRRALRGTGAAASFVALPPGADRYAPGRWWRTPRGIRVVVSEVVKLAVYRFWLRP
jgi:hypothetical protein